MTEIPEANVSLQVDYSPALTLALALALALALGLALVAVPEANISLQALSALLD